MCLHSSSEMRQNSTKWNVRLKQLALNWEQRVQCAGIVWLCTRMANATMHQNIWNLWFLCSILFNNTSKCCWSKDNDQMSCDRPNSRAHCQGGIECHLALLLLHRAAARSAQNMSMQSAFGERTQFKMFADFTRHLKQTNQANVSFLQSFCIRVYNESQGRERRNTTTTTTKNHNFFFYPYKCKNRSRLCPRANQAQTKTLNKWPNEQTIKWIHKTERLYFVLFCTETEKKHTYAKLHRL